MVMVNNFSQHIFLLLFIPILLWMVHRLKYSSLSNLSQSKQVEPFKAANMFKLHYNVTLQAYAEKWVNQCKLAHSGGPYGENMWSFTDNNEDYRLFPYIAVGNAIYWWWDELKHNGFDEQNLILTKQNIGPIRHWAQLAWAETSQFGCAVKNCSTSNFLVMCAYDKAPKIGAPVYKKGESCSACSDYPEAHCESVWGIFCDTPTKQEYFEI